MSADQSIETALKIHETLGAAGLEYCAYSCNGVNLFGDRKSIDAVAVAFHSHAQIAELQTNLRHWRDECGKLHAKIRNP
jgi:hypothetical protein